MGAYGSPELYPPEQPKQSRYIASGYYSQQYSPYPYKQKRPNRVLPFVIGLVSGFIIIGAVNQYNEQQPHYQAPAQAAFASVQSDSDVYLENWVREAVVKELTYPETAQFSGNSADWQIVRNGDLCTVSSYVMAEGKNKQVSRSPFIVKIQYSGLSAHVTFLQIGSQVSYDESKSGKK